MYTGVPYVAPSTGGLGALSSGISLLKRINWSSFLTNTQKVLNVANQAIPLYYQTKPIFQNIKALGKIGKEFNNIGVSNNTNSNANINNQYNNNQSATMQEDLPTPRFFL